MQDAHCCSTSLLTATPSKNLQLFEVSFHQAITFGIILKYSLVACMKGKHNVFFPSAYQDTHYAVLIGTHCKNKKPVPHSADIVNKDKLA